MAAEGDFALGDGDDDESDDAVLIVMFMLLLAALAAFVAADAAAAAAMARDTMLLDRASLLRLPVSLPGPPFVGPNPFSLSAERPVVALLTAAPSRNAAARLVCERLTVAVAAVAPLPPKLLLRGSITGGDDMTTDGDPLLLLLLL